MFLAAPVAAFVTAPVAAPEVDGLATFFGRVRNGDDVVGGRGASIKPARCQARN